MKKEFRALRIVAEAQGWTVTLTRNNHLAWRSPTGALVISSFTPSDKRAILNLRAFLRRNGLILPA